MVEPMEHKAKVEIVYTKTSDDILLAGSYIDADSCKNKSISALIFFHGDGGNFYNPSICIWVRS